MTIPAQPVEAVAESLIAAWATSVGAEVDGGDAPDHRSNYSGYGATITFDLAQLAAFVRLAYSTRNEGSTSEPVFLHGLLLVKNDSGFWLHHPNGNDYNGPFETREEATKTATLNHPRHVDGDLVDAARGLLADYEADHGEGACDCMPEPQNAGHACNACLVRAALAHSRPVVDLRPYDGMRNWEVIADAATARAELTDPKAAKKLRCAMRSIITAGLAAGGYLPPAAPTAEQAGEVVTERQVACIAACIAHGRYVSDATAGNEKFLKVLREALFEAGISQPRPVGVSDDAALLRDLRQFHEETEACSEFDLPSEAIAALLVANLIEGTHYTLTKKGEAMLAAAPAQARAEDA